MHISTIHRFPSSGDRQVRLSKMMLSSASVLGFPSLFLNGGDSGASVLLRRDRF
ncbi:MAG TPA: hypothetical protein V6C90_22920 [Coleofasciculaceae cyanobacterium]